MRISPRLLRSGRAFTLIELTIVLVIIGVITALAVVRTGSLAYWKEENFLRKLSETIVFLHYQAVVDQAFYRIEFDFEHQSYRVGILKVEDADEQSELADLSDIGNVSLELAAYLNPSLGTIQTFIPPPSLPSLIEPVPLPEGSRIRDIHTMRGKEMSGKPYVLFSPRGFSEFSVIHLVQSSGAILTILINPFTGNTDIIRGDKDFEWSYGRSKKK